MQYLLTSEEFSDLSSREARARKELNATIQSLCSQVADLKPVESGWAAGKPWGCILTTQNEYCDECPVQKLCPNPHKNWSK